MESALDRTPHRPKLPLFYFVYIKSVQKTASVTVIVTHFLMVTSQYLSTAQI